VSEGLDPLHVQLQLSRLSRVVRIQTHPEAVVTLRPHGQPQQVLRNGDEREFDVGQRLIAGVRLAGLPALPDQDLVVQPGQGPQSIDLPVVEPATIKLPHFPYRLCRIQGGWFHSGFEPRVYEELLRQKLPDFSVGILNKEPIPRNALAPALQQPDPEMIQKQALLLDDARFKAEKRIKENRRKFKQNAKHHGTEFISPFYVSEVPVTWGHWVEVMGDADLPDGAREDVRRFLRERSNEPAVRIRFVRWFEFCRRLTEESRSSGPLGSNWEFTLPRAVEIEYLLKGGLSEADASQLGKPVGAGRGALRNQVDPLKECVNSWLTVEHNLEKRRSCRNPLTVWDSNLRRNRLNILLGLVATWTEDPAGGERHTIAGPSFRTHPNKADFLKWKEDWPEPAQLGLPNQRQFILHDIDGYWPWSKTTHPNNLPTEDHIGMYLVLRQFLTPNKQVADTR
jgi:formylglycine-generating enzyme required for sulfatase activity